jgi:hypothetical protein
VTAVSKTRLTAAVAVALFLRWLAVGHVSMTIGGASMSVPALVIVAGCVLAVTAAAAALLVYRVRAEQVMLAARLRAAGQGGAR